MTEANSRSWKVDGAKEDFRIEDFEAPALAEAGLEVAAVTCFLPMLTAIRSSHKKDNG